MKTTTKEGSIFFARVGDGSGVVYPKGNVVSITRRSTLVMFVMFHTSINKDEFPFYVEVMVG